MKNKKKILSLVIIIGVIIIPLAYSLFYLGAFWDPYSRLDELPVAIVNEDNGAEINGEARNVGNELVDKLTDSEALKFITTDEQEALDGINGTEYYAVITIPEDFSTNIASAETTDKKAATITYSSNEKRNFLATQIINRAVLEVEEEARGSVNKEITGQLVSQLALVPTKLTELSSGLGDISDGSIELKDGISTLSDGQSELLTGINSLDSGLTSAVSGSTELSSGIGTLHEGITQTDAGAKQILSSLEGSKPEISALTEGANQLNDGAKTLAAGLEKASAGAQTLYNAASSEESGLPALQSGIAQLDTGANTVAQGVSGYVSGVNSMIDQNTQVSQQLAAIYSSTTLSDSQKVAAVGQLLTVISSSDSQTKISSLAAAGSTLQAGAAQIAAGADTLNSNKDSLTTLQNGMFTLSSSLDQLYSGASQLSSGTNTLAVKTNSFTTLITGMNALVNGLDKLNIGSQTLYEGSQSLATGIASAKEGSGKLASGAAELQSGTAKLSDGIAALSDGVTTAKTSVDDAIIEANDELTATEGLDSFAAEPLTIEQEPLNTVPNYGTAFAPYFLSLSLYVGALIMFVGIYLDADEKIKTLSRSTDKRVKRVVIFALIGVAQAIALALLIKYALGLTVANMPAYFMSCVLVSMVFISIVEFFMVYLQDLGKFLAMILLILQLTSCGGTFPVETVPKFFRVLYPYMPMTYSVKLFKEAISGYDASNADSAIWVLLAIFAVFTALNIIFSIGKKAKDKTKRDGKLENLQLDTLLK